MTKEALVGTAIVFGLIAEGAIIFWAGFKTGYSSSSNKGQIKAAVTEAVNEVTAPVVTAK